MHVHFTKNWQLAFYSGKMWHECNTFHCIHAFKIGVTLKSTNTPLIPYNWSANIILKLLAIGFQTYKIIDTSQIFKTRVGTTTDINT